MEIELVDATKLKVQKWFGDKRELACVRTFSGAIQNMVVGVTQGFRFTLRSVYAHFPIKLICDSDKELQIQNFLGEKRIRVIKMRGDTTVIKSKDVKDQIVLEGNSINDVSQSAADIQQSTRVRNKDIRKFLDGIYVSESGPIVVVQE